MLTNRSFPLGLNYEQGIGFAEYSDGWPMPEACAGTLKIIDDENNVHVLVLDYRDGCFYDISVRDGYSGSNIINTFKDKINTDGTGGVDIPTSIKFKEDTGEYEKFSTEHHVSHFYVRPFKESYRNTTGYDNRGFPTGIEFTSKIYVDGEPTEETATAEQINKYNEIVYDKHVEGRRLQTEFSSNMSGFRFLGRQQEYITKDIIKDPDLRITTEGTNQSNLSSNMLRWYTRGEQPLVCRISDLVNTSIVSFTTGPDNKLDSAMVVSIGNSFNVDITGISLQSTISFWCDGTFELRNNGVAQSVTNVTNHPTGYNLYRCTLLPNTSLVIYATTEIKLFDIRLYNGSVTNFTYYVNDVEHNNADNVCPLY